MKIAIAGYGVEGQANYNYFSRMLDADITIVDESETPKLDLPTGVKTLLGKGSFEKLQGFDMVVRTAGLSPYKIVTDGKIWSATNEFFAKCPAPIIGVTGTKGKGTTSSMIVSILEAAGRTVWFVGNIGTASLSVLDTIKPTDVVVYELSSFQLWDIQKSPQIAVVLGIESEHLDVHRDFDDYVSAKGNIRRFQTPDDFCVFNSDNFYARHIVETSETPSQAYGLTAGGGAHVRGEFFYVGEHIICSTSEVQLRGQHNIENACAAIAVAHHLDISNDEIATGLRNFKGLPHRLEYVTTIDGVAYYNDSFSSSTPATVAAVRSFTEPEIVIIGGVDRGGDFDHLAAELKKQPNIKELVLIGEIRHELAELFAAEAITAKVTVLDATTMRDIVSYASAEASEGDVVILSPGCASFDLFKDFYDRGDQFRREVQALAHNDDTFVFEGYTYDATTGRAEFTYGFKQADVHFTEAVMFRPSADYDTDVLDRTLRLAFYVAGTSYFKTYPTRNVKLPHGIDEWQAEFLNSVYQEGLSQFAFENNLTRDDLAQFTATSGVQQAVGYAGSGVLSLQSGGKDSLLTATLLKEKSIPFEPWYLTSSDYYPHILDDLGEPLVTAKRELPLAMLKAEIAKGGRNGHVPVTYIVQTYALVQAILDGKNQVLVSIAHEGEEPHAQVGDLPITHQWSKTWGAEQQYAEYVQRYISPDITIGSPLRQYSELRVAEVFVQHAWPVFGTRFSSCNRANYRQAADNSELHWCGDCPKCANSYLLFAPFIDADQLKALFAGQELFEKPSLEHTFKGLLGIDGVMKPFECVGEIDELRYAYQLAQAKGGYGQLPFDVPTATFDYLHEYPSQAVIGSLLD